MNIRTEWHRAPDFAEAAEALGISTTLVMAMKPGDPAVVLFSRDEESYPPTILMAELRRDADGILVAGPAREEPGLWAEIVAALNRKLDRDDA